MVDLSNKGWLKVPGIRPMGDRTLEEQMLGLDPALAEASGKTVLDLGCAEGLIGREFAKAGATRVLGIELLKSHLEVARKACKGYKQMEFVCAHIGHYIAANCDQNTATPDGSFKVGYPRETFDIVLALGIIHKLEDPAVPLVFAARAARSLLCFRAPARATDGVVAAKHGGKTCNVPEIMKREGFVEERLIPGVRGEAVQYWRRK